MHKLTANASWRTILPCHVKALVYSLQELELLPRLVLETGCAASSAILGTITVIVTMATLELMRAFFLTVRPEFFIALDQKTGHTCHTHVTTPTVQSQRGYTNL